MPQRRLFRTNGYLRIVDRPANSIKNMALARVSSWDIRKEAVRQGMRTLRMDAWDKVTAGDTSVDEVLRVTKGEAL